MKIEIQALRQELSQNDVEKLLPSDIRQRLQGNGVIQAYVLAHEGTTSPRVIGEGQQKLSFGRAVIEKLSKVIQAGTKFFKLHGQTNSHENRKPLGEVIFSTLKEIGGKLSTLVFGHFPDAQSVLEMDVVSMEAEIQTENDQQTVASIDDVTGIAMGSSNSESPAFPGAKRLAMIQCFESDDIKPDEGKKKESKQMTFDEVKAAVRDMNIRPGQLYTIDDLKKDTQFAPEFDKLNILQTDNERLKKEKEELDKKTKEIIRKNEIADAGKILDNVLKSGYTEQQKSVLKELFDPATLNEINETTVKSFVEKNIERVPGIAKIFGQTENRKPADGINPRTDSQETDEDPVDELLKVSGV